MSLEKLFSFNISGSSRVIVFDTAIVETMRNQLSTNGVDRFADVITTQAKRNMGLD